MNNFNIKIIYLLLNFKHTFHPKAYKVIMVNLISKQLQKY